MKKYETIKSNEEFYRKHIGEAIPIKKGGCKTWKEDYEGKKSNEELSKAYQKLCKVCYGNNEKERERYNSKLTRLFTEGDEELDTGGDEEKIQKLFLPVGKAKKILATVEHKTFDFKIDENEDIKLLIEGTSINPKTYFPNNPIQVQSPDIELEKFIQKINMGIEHAEEKEAKNGYHKIVVIYYDVFVLMVFGYYPENLEKLADPNFIERTKFLSGTLDAIIIALRGFGHTSKAEYDQPYWAKNPPETVCWIKNHELLPILGKLPIKKKVHNQEKSYTFLCWIS